MTDVVAVVTSSAEGGGGEMMEVDNGDKIEGSSEVIGWEKLLPRNKNRMVLRVLLVEADDSTRQIISALLRKCSYKVTAVPDGLMAWETLKGKPHNIDLILTEVELPSISGYALLTLIMEHDVCRNIPVIMMSSHDSISMVFKCMLKGAADFLIKPVRRNELKNLWHHVWRRQTLTAGPPNSPNAQHKVEATSVNNSSSDHSSDCATSSHKSKEFSDKGSDAHGSKVGGRISSSLGNMEKKRNEEFTTLDKSSAIPESENADWSTRLQPVDLSCNESYNQAVLKLEEENAFTKITIQDERTRPPNDSRNADSPRGHNAEHMGSSRGAIDLIGAFDNDLKRTYGHVNINDDANKSECPSQLELSLRRFFPNSSTNQTIDERSVLNHSNASAFSRYNGKILQPEWQSRNHDYSGYLLSNQCSENANHVAQPLGSNLNENQETITTLLTCQSGKTEPAYSNPVSGLMLDNICDWHGHAISPSRNAETGLPSWNAKLASQREQSPYPSSTSIHSNHEIQDSEQNNRQSADTTANSVDQDMHQRNNTECVEELKHCSPAAAQSTSSSMCNSVSDHNYSSAHGTFITKSDGNVILPPSEQPTIPENSNGGIFLCDKFRGMDANRSSQREAALMKFRLKRKDRCYEKKVRYQSRKRLAEMRPRVKGQFVRQVQNEATIPDTKD